MIQFDESPLPEAGTPMSALLILRGTCGCTDVYTMNEMLTQEELQKHQETFLHVMLRDHREAGTKVPEGYTAVLLTDVTPEAARKIADGIVASTRGGYTTTFDEPFAPDASATISDLLRTMLRKIQGDDVCHCGARKITVPAGEGTLTLCPRCDAGASYFTGA